MFPFSRGLSEDKVANVWFCLDVFLNLRHRLATLHLAKLSLVSTLRKRPLTNNYAKGNLRPGPVHHLSSQ
ncbi:unnamed protein product [Ascophyllum nodosum]